MKDIFPGFYNNTRERLEKAWKANETLFVFDTNTLLNIYSYAEQTRNDFFEILKNIESKVWLPHHVALEYQRRRLDVIKNEKNIFTKIEAALNKIDQVFEKDLKELSLDRRLPDIETQTKKLRNTIQKNISRYKTSIEKWNERQPDVRSHDSIREKLDHFFIGKIGPPPPNQGWLTDLFREGETRYKNKVPPGYEDSDKSKSPDNEYCHSGLTYQRQFGDLIIWKQILERCKDKEIQSVILVTDDNKKDWWEIIDSRGKKTIGPRPELREEITRESTIDLFDLYSTADFLESGSKLLHVDIKKESISDAEHNFIDKKRYYLPTNFSDIDSLSAVAQTLKNLRVEDIETIIQHENERRYAYRKEFFATPDLHFENYLKAKEHDLQYEEFIKKLADIIRLKKTSNNEPITPEDNNTNDQQDQNSLKRNS